MARDRQTEQIVGLKILDKDKTDQLEMRFRGLDKPSEGEIASQFNHPRIVTHAGLRRDDQGRAVRRHGVSRRPGTQLADHRPEPAARRQSPAR